MSVEIRHHLAGRHFDTVIRYSVKLAEAASHGVPIADYCQHCAGFDDYQALAAEVLQHEAAVPKGERVTVTTRASASNDHLPPSAPAVTPEGVMFSIGALNAERVQLAGDFNDWTLDGSEMEPLGGVWRKIVKLPPGRYRYRYVIDGQWQSDPLNAAVEPNSYGEHDSVLVVDERVAS